MSLLGDLLGPRRVGFYLFGCFILFFSPFSSPPSPCRVPGGGGIAGVAICSLSGDDSGKESPFPLMDAWGGPAPRWIGRGGARLLLLLLTVRLGSG